MVKPNYRNLLFWEKVQDEICEVIHCLTFYPNGLDMAGNENAARVEVLYGDNGYCLLQMFMGCTPLNTATVMLADCEDLPGDYKRDNRVLCVSCHGDGCENCDDEGLMTPEQAEDYADSIVESIVP